MLTGRETQGGWQPCRALLIGTGWTLAAAVALAVFKSSLAEPIYLWPLGVVAFGWAGVLLHALAAEQRTASSAQQELMHAGDVELFCCCAGGG